jgi:hypothetical protein
LAAGVAPPGLTPEAQQVRAQSFVAPRKQALTEALLAHAPIADKSQLMETVSP